jgi:hypothetical protein
MSVSDYIPFATAQSKPLPLFFDFISLKPPFLRYYIWYRFRGAVITNNDKFYLTGDNENKSSTEFSVSYTSRNSTLAMMSFWSFGLNSVK